MSHLRRHLPDLSIILLLFLLPLVFFFPQTLGGRTLIPTENLYQYEPFATYREVVRAPEIPHNHLVSDLILENYQWKWFTRQQLSQGEVPLWNPHQFSGIPFLAAGQHSALYPLSIIYYVLPLTSAYGWFTVINLWLAGVFMVLLVRFLGIGRTGALLAGIIYQFNGFVIASVVFQMMIGGIPWLPLLLLMTEYILREKPLIGKTASPLPPVAIGAGALALNILAGHVEITIYTLLIVGYYAAGRLLWEFWRSRKSGRTENTEPTAAGFPPQSIIQKCVWLILMVAIGFGLGAIQFIPLFEFVQTNWRAGKTDYDTVLSYAHPVRDVLQFVIPNFYGNPSHHSYFDVFTGQTVTALKNAAGDNIHFIEWGMKNYVEGAVYLGILPLLLAVYGFLKSHVPYNFIFASLGVFSLTFMFGLPTYALLYALPGINQLNSPFRWIYALTVCVAILAAFGWQALISPQSHRGLTEKFFSKRNFALVTMGAGILILLALFLSHVFFTNIEPLIERLFHGLALAETAFADARAFYSYEFPHIFIAGVMLILSGMVFLLAKPSSSIPSNNTSPPLAPLATALHPISITRRGGFIKPIFAVALVAIDLMLASYGFNPASDPLLLDFTPPVVRFLQQKQAEGEIFRFTTLDDPAQRPMMNANSGWSYGLYDIRGYDSIIPKQYVDYMSALAVQGQLGFNRIAPFFTSDMLPAEGKKPGVLQPDSPLLDWLNVRYILTHRSTNLFPAEGDSAWKIVHEDEAVRVYENPDVFPRAYLIPEDNFSENWLTPSSEPVNYEAFFLPSSPAPQGGEAVITRDTGREKFVDVSLDTDGWLIVSENYAPGWRAFVRPMGAGEDAETAYEVQRVLGMFQAVKLPAGDWTVRLVYSPTSFQVGLFGSIISVGILTLMIGIWVWRLLVGESDEKSSTTARVARNSIAPILLNLFNRGMDFALLLVILRILSPENVGTYYYLVVIFEWFDIFTNFGLDLFLVREVARDKSRAGHYIFNVSLLRLLLCGVGVPLLMGFLFIRQSVIMPQLDAEALLTVGLLYVGLFPASLSKGMTSLFYAFEQAEKPAAIATITSINKAVFQVIALLLGYGIVGLAVVSIFNNVITLVVLLAAGRKLINLTPRPHPLMPALNMEREKVKLDFPLLRRITVESVPLLLNHFLATIFFKVDVILLEAMKGAVVVAQYSVAYRWILAINIIPSFFTQALLPVMSRQAQSDKPTLHRTYIFGIKLLVLLAFPMAVWFTFLAEPLTYFMGGQQYLPDGAIAIQLMIWSIPIGWMNSLTQYALVALDLQRRITGAFFVAVTFNIVTNALLIPIFSYPAAAITTIASEAVLLIPFALLMRQGLEMPLRWVDLLWRPAAATIAMLIVTLVLWQIVPGIALPVGSLVYAVVLLSLHPLAESELALLRRMLPERLAGSRFARLILNTTGK